MGCDIHAQIERKTKYGWTSSGDPDIGRNYEMYAVLAGVRNYDDITPIAEPRGFPDEYPEYPSQAMSAMREEMGADAHSLSWLTLAEIKAFDTTQEVDDGRLVTATADGRPTEVCRSTTGAHMGAVGRRRILTWPGEDEPKRWLSLIDRMERCKWDGQSDDEIRLIFFFDN